MRIYYIQSLYRLNEMKIYINFGYTIYKYKRILRKYKQLNSISITIHEV